MEFINQFAEHVRLIQGFLPYLNFLSGHQMAYDGSRGAS